MSIVARENNNKKFNWGPLMDAITQVESEGNSRAVSGTQCGAMQITPILVEDCNAILKRRGEKKRFTLNDRFSVKKSIRIWNGGVNYTNKGTQRYYKKVMALYKQ